MTVIVLLINYPKSTITVVHWNDDSNETLFSSYLLGPYVSSIGILVFADCGFGKYRRVIFFNQGISLEFS